MPLRAPSGLEVELQRQLHGAVSEPVGHDAGAGCIDWCCTKVSNCQLECGVAAHVALERAVVQEPPKRMVKEVERLRPELQAFRLRDLEVLEHGQVTVGKHWTVDIRDPVRAILSVGRRLEARTIEDLMRLQVSSGVADQQWHDRHIRRSVDVAGNQSPR